MKILRLLNKKYLSIILIIIFFNTDVSSEDKPIDIWNINEEQVDNIDSKDISLSTESENKSIQESSIYELQSQKQIDTVEVDSKLFSKKIKIIGLYDPEDYNLKIDMWSNSNGDQLKNLFSNLDKLDLSEDASDLMNIVLLTNAHYPKKNISEKEFLEFKSDWLIKNKNRNLIEEYLIKNQIINLHPKLTRFLIDQYLSESNLSKACEIFTKNSEVIEKDYLSRFNLYCLINEGKKEEAQLVLDLKKELGFKNEYFENKINFLFGYTSDPDLSVSENSILDFHLAHRTNPNFFFEPKENTDKLIWKYLASSNLLYNIEEIDINQLDKISLIEKATNDKNYSEEELFNLYKRFQFNVSQYLNVTESYKILSNVEARALVYQRILLESDPQKKIELIKFLKDLFIKDDLSNAFEYKLKEFLENIDSTEVPSNLTTFYFNYKEKNREKVEDVRFNKDILHQSKLVNYFNGDYAKSKISKDINNFLKKIKKDKKYILTKKDIILIESMKSDGIDISKKYDDLYQIDETEMPTDIQVMINNQELGSTILRIIEVIGQDELVMLDDDTLFFIISALNQLNVDFIRNKILLKVLPLKV
ncbi:hypothetical protein OA107_04045 [Candidatus Pelagibacter sp.]|nr:hypothetical protein [Candidatus Pelagibacter sp.]